MPNPQAVAEQLMFDMLKPTPPIEPEGLEQLTPGVHQYLGDLPHELCHVFVTLCQMNERLFAFNQGSGAAVTEASKLFIEDVALKFNLQPGDVFVILAGFKTALLTKPPQPAIVEHDDKCAF